MPWISVTNLRPPPALAWGNQSHVFCKMQCVPSRTACAVNRVKKVERWAGASTATTMLRLLKETLRWRCVGRWYLTGSPEGLVRMGRPGRGKEEARQSVLSGHGPARRESGVNLAVCCALGTLSTPSLQSAHLPPSCTFGTAPGPERSPSRHRAGGQGQSHAEQSRRRNSRESARLRWLPRAHHPAMVPEKQADVVMTTAFYPLQLGK